MKNKICLLFGGTSEEAEVSLKSVKYIYNNINRLKNEVIILYLDKTFKFYLVNENLNVPNSLSDIIVEEEIFFIYQEIFSLKNFMKISRIDLVLSLVHGESGEDGNLQGFFNLLNIQYSGCGLSSSAVTINKYITKLVLEKHGIPVCKSLLYREGLDFKEVEKKIGYPMIIKPTSLGSSIGINLITNGDEYLEKIKQSLRYSNQLMIEEFLDARELECAVLENINSLYISEIGEIVKNSIAIYTFEEKYFKENAKIQIPADIPIEIEIKIKEYTELIFKILECKGYARIDFFMDSNNNIFFNEINTIPGFTEKSMFPKLLEYERLSSSQIVEIIIANGMQNKKGVNY